MSKKAVDFARQYRVTNGKKFRLKDHDPGDTWKVGSKERAAELLEKGTEQLNELQDKLYAQNCWALLLVFQAMDAAGKDATIKHVMTGVNPQGCHVTAFKAPSTKELSHDFLWRSTAALPERGRIGIFNRSYYEEVLVVRVHPNLLEKEGLPEQLIKKGIWKDRFEDINAYERYLTRNGVVIRKFFLHVSKEEQKKRLIERLEKPEKNWKFQIGDLRERELWDEYMEAYEEMIQRTATPDAPWYVIPADHKWFTRVVVSAAIVETLESLNVDYPKVSDEQRQELATARGMLEAREG